MSITNMTDIFTKNRVFISILIVIIIFLFNYNAGLKHDLKKSEQNKAYYKNLMKIEKDDKGRLVHSRNTLMVSLEELEDANSDLKNEIESLNRKVKIIQKSKTNIVEIKDTTRIKDTLYIDSNKTKNITFEYNNVYDENNSKHIKGLVKIDTNNNTESYILLDSMNISLVTGLSETKDGLYEIFITSDYPNFNVKEIDGAMVDMSKYNDPNKGKYNISAMLGVGVDNTLTIRPFLGVGVTRRILRLK